MKFELSIIELFYFLIVNLFSDVILIDSSTCPLQFSGLMKVGFVQTQLHPPAVAGGSSVRVCRQDDTRDVRQGGMGSNMICPPFLLGLSNELPPFQCQDPRRVPLSSARTMAAVAPVGKSGAKVKWCLSLSFKSPIPRLIFPCVNRLLCQHN